MVRVNFILPIKMAIFHQVLSLGEGNKKIKLKKISFIFIFNFQKIGSGGSVKRKIKKLWPYSAG